MKDWQIEEQKRIAQNKKEIEALIKKLDAREFGKIKTKIKEGTFTAMDLAEKIGITAETMKRFGVTAESIAKFADAIKENTWTNPVDIWAKTRASIGPK